MLTGIQIRAARHALKWTFKQLAIYSSVSARTLKSLETFDGVPECRTATLNKVKLSLESAGIEFIGTPEDRPGIRVSISN